MALKTDYKDDVFSGDRKYQKKDNSDGTISLVDKTAYSQKGDTFSAADINATNQAVNGLSAVATTSASGLMSAEDKSKLDNLQVGGRNLLTNSKGEFSSGYPADGKVPNYVMQQKVPLPADATHFVLSFDAKSTVDGDGLFSFFYNPANVSKTEVSSVSRQTANNSNDGRVTTSLTTEWKRYWIKWTVPVADTRTVLPMRLDAGQGTGKVSMRNVKFEVGTVPTDWTPAPEDVDSKIDELNNNGPNVLHEYVSRPASANDIPGNDRKLKWFLSSGIMTEGKPFNDGYIIHFSWDRANWASQLYIPSGGSGKIVTPQFRMRNADTDEWDEWVNIYSEYHPQSSITKSFTLSASSWSSGRYTISDSLITATSNQEVIPDPSISREQYKAFQRACLVGAQTQGKLMLLVYGTVPTIDIPIRIIFRGTI